MMRHVSASETVDASGDMACEMHRARYLRLFREDQLGVSIDAPDIGLCGFQFFFADQVPLLQAHACTQYLKNVLLCVIAKDGWWHK